MGSFMKSGKRCGSRGVFRVPFSSLPLTHTQFQFRAKQQKPETGTKHEKKAITEDGMRGKRMNATYDPMRTVRETCYCRWSKGTCSVHGGARIGHGKSGKQQSFVAAVRKGRDLRARKVRRTGSRTCLESDHTQHTRLTDDKRRGSGPRRSVFFAIISLVLDIPLRRRAKNQRTGAKGVELCFSAASMSTARQSAEVMNISMNTP
jgi:hypothetical protein